MASINNTEQNVNSHNMPSINKKNFNSHNKLNVLFSVDLSFLPSELTESKAKYMLLMQNMTLPITDFVGFEANMADFDWSEYMHSPTQCEHVMVVENICQTRSADEAATAIYKCSKCNWRSCKN